MSHRRMEHEKSKQNIAFVVYCVSSQPDDKYGELQIPGKKELGHKGGGKQAFKQIKMNYGTKKRSCFLGFQSLSRECNCVEIFFIWQDIRFRFGPREYISTLTRIGLCLGLRQNMIADIFAFRKTCVPQIGPRSSTSCVEKNLLWSLNTKSHQTLRPASYIWLN